MLHALATRCVRLAATLASHLALALGAIAADYPLPAPGDDLIGALQVTVAQAEETLLDIGRRHDLGFNEIAAANPDIDPWLPGAGARVVLPTQFVLPPGPRTGIVINLAQMRLFYFPQGSRFPRDRGQVITHPLGVAAELSATPLGSTRVVRKTVDPTWHPPQSIRLARAAAGEILPEAVPPGPDNPLGGHALYLGFSSYLVHGTNRPWGIGMRVSGGCIRLYPEDIASLFSAVPVGTPVRIIDDPFAVGLLAGEPYLQVFSQPEREESKRTYTPLVEALVRTAPRAALDWNRVLRTAKEQRALPVPVNQGAATPEQLLGRARQAAPVDQRGAR